jgi:RNA polymerase sigma-70 factor (ECF subfamily)
LVYYWCRGAQLQPADAADVLQDVFHAVARSLDRFQNDHQRGSFRGWLCRITANKLHDYWREHRRVPRAAGGSTHGQFLEQLADEPISLDTDAAPEPEETSLVLQRALEVFQSEFELPTWQAFWRVTIDGRSPADVAAELGITINAVYKAKARVLSRLRAELRPLVDLRHQ